MNETEETISMVRGFIERLEEIERDLYYAVENIYFYGIPEEHKPYARKYFEWLKMKLSHLVEEAKFELERLEEKLWEIKRSKEE